MKAILLAAGFGTRLKPLTDSTPKALIDVNGVPLIFYNLALLKHFGLNELVINLHHLGEQIETKLGDGSRLGLKIHYSHEEKILGTGGGILKAAQLISEDHFLVVNADIITDINLTRLLETHHQNGALATLVTRPDATALKPVFVDGINRITGIHQALQAGQPHIFTGVHVISKTVLDLLKADEKQCIVRNAYLPLLEAGKFLAAYPQNGFWSDLGTRETLAETRQKLAHKKVVLSYFSTLGTFLA